ncbi:MAG: CDP-alcohol phosphatidyltransferase family protein [Pseudomonadales bacterium]|nr:CDP-alcohol phosphatidyltransferase family protein [Pseudomonadales bacterium]
MLTLANAITFIRLALIAPGAWLIYSQQWVWATGLFLVAILTDIADGPIARKLNQSTAFGRLFDHGSDALYVTICLGAFACLGAIPAILPTMILIAFTQYVLDSKALAGNTLRMSLVGQSNGIAYFILLGTLLAQNLTIFDWLPAKVSELFALALIASTAISMLDRLWALFQVKRSNR